MASITKIVFCTDFSEYSHRAFDLTQKHQAQLFLVHAVPPLVLPSTLMGDFISEQAIQ